MQNISNSANTWLLHLKQDILPKFFSFFQQNRKLILISASIVGGSLIIYGLVSKRSHPTPSRKSSENSNSSHHRSSIRDNPSFHIKDFPHGVGMNHTKSPDGKKRNINPDEISAQSQAAKGSLNTGEKYQPNMREYLDDLSDYPSETLSSASHWDEKEVRNQRRGPSEDPDELFFSIFQKVNSSLK